MPVISPPIPIEKPKSGYGGGGLHPPARGGGGDNGPGDGSSDYSRRLHRARLGLLLALGSICILFITITVVFFLLRHGAVVLDPETGSYIRRWVPVHLPTGLLIVNTIILLASSITIEMARRSIAREMIFAEVRSIPGIAVDRERGTPWLGMTIVLGALFLVGQWLAWHALESRGFHIFTGVPSPFFYVLTGAHAVHLSVGLIVLLYAGLISSLHRAIEQRRIVIEVAAWYWHFMGALWIYIFALLQLGH